MLSVLDGVRVGLVATWLASAVFVHFRGRVRHPFLRQLVDHSTFLAPYNALVFLFSKVRGRRFVDVAELPQLAPLAANWRAIRDEALRLHEAERLRASDSKNDIAFNTFFRRGWKRFYLKWYDAFLPSAEALCPETVALVRSIPSVNAALFAYLPPGGKLGEHRDPFAGALRYHLGLVTPNSDACRIYVDGEPYAWRDGEAVVFDETFVHSVRNETDQGRIVLFCDVERPLAQPMRSVNRFVARHLVRATATDNEPGERVGIVNRVAGRLQAFKEAMNRLKHRNKPLYRVVKFLVLGGIVWLIGVQPFL